LCVLPWPVVYPRSVSTHLVDLQQRAVELAKGGMFGPDGLEVNLEITTIDPANEGAWTRLARCYMEQRRFADAAGALATVLELNPSNSIAKSLLSEVTRRKAMAPAPSEAASGFTAQDFHALGQLAPSDAMRAVGPKFESLLVTLNEQRTAARIVEARSRAGHPGTKLFHRNSFYSGGSGHIFAYQHGGRWEPQFNVGMFSDAPWGFNAVRVGLGFNLSQDGRDQDREGGQEQAVSYFEAFQYQLDTMWRGHLSDWMEKTGGFIQYSDRGPAMQMMPKDAVEWLVKCHNPAALGWVFAGRWLFLDKAPDAQILGEMRKLVATVEDTFAALFPLWTATYSPTR
jgi:tetratricopeptide repeat protein